MSLSRMLAVIATALALPLPLAAQDSPLKVVPENPVQFERVHLRMTVDSCTFDEQSVRVALSDQVLRVRYQPLLCLIPGPPEVVDVQLGAFPAGSYRVEFYQQGDEQPLARREFQVTDIATVAFVSPRPFPLADHSGLWGSDIQPGMGLSLHQGAQHSLFGALYVFDEASRPHWYTLQEGSWESSTRWTGKLVESKGPAWSTPSWLAADASYDVVGKAEIDFRMSPGQEGVAAVTYTLRGTTVSLSMTRWRL